MDKSDMRKLWEADVESCAEICQRRYAEPPAEPAIPVVDLLGDKPACAEEDCDGLLVLPRDNVTFALRDYAYCLLCGRRRKVIK